MSHFPATIISVFALFAISSALAIDSLELPGPCDDSYHYRYFANDVTFLATLMNRGTDMTQSQVRFYLSSNDYISNYDIYIGGGTFTGEAGSTGTFDLSLPIPTSVASGNYYVGHLFDPNDNVSEVNESNNAVALRKPIKVMQ
ncbi:MAG: hypothetical protein CME06_14465 [Gemmatimonadetes bacterium]|nr:hypothetical protein [Gemmatimonadota bacterium]